MNIVVVIYVRDYCINMCNLESTLSICVKITFLLYPDNTFHFKYFLNKLEPACKIYPTGKNHTTSNILMERHSSPSKLLGLMLSYIFSQKLN